MRVRQLGISGVLAACAAMVFMGAPGASAATQAPQGSADPSPNITVTQTTAPSWLCLPSFFAITHSVKSTPTEFILTANAWIRPCNTVTAHAVIYKMPGNGVAWPQTLGEKQTFTISQKGITTITFTKGCEPVQFDVIQGATPQVVAPWGPWHGPLLFPFALETSQQYFPGPDCNAGGECDDYTPQQVVVNPTNVNAGDQVTVSGTGVPGDTVVATLETNPAVQLGSAPVDANGQFSISGTIPAGTPPGDLNIKVSSENCPTSVTVTVTVGQVLAAKKVAVELPGGGSGPNSAPLRSSVGIGAALIGLFAFTRLTGRRVRSRSAK